MMLWLSRSSKGASQLASAGCDFKFFFFFSDICCSFKPKKGDVEVFCFTRWDLEWLSSLVFNITVDSKTMRHSLMLLTREQNAELRFNSVHMCFFRILDGSSHKACHPVLLVWHGFIGIGIRIEFVCFEQLSVSLSLFLFYLDITAICPVWYKPLCVVIAWREPIPSFYKKKGKKWNLFSMLIHRLMYHLAFPSGQLSGCLFFSAVFNVSVSLCAAAAAAAAN